jgi:hypothetical protein
MKRQIRRGCWETNSSSQHSLVVMKNDDHYTTQEISKDFYLHEDGVWDAWSADLDFGRTPFRVLGTFKTKWLYACASLVKEYNDDTYKKLKAFAIKYIPGLREIKMPTTISHVPNLDNEKNKDNWYAQKYGKTEAELNEYLDQKEEEWEIEGLEYWEDRAGDFCFTIPYTGHTDEPFLQEFLEHENLSLEEYLTNRKYVIVQDGDEYCYWQDMKKAGLVNSEAIDHEFPDQEGE